VSLGASAISSAVPARTETPSTDAQLATEPAPIDSVPDLDLDRLRDAVCSALDSAGHNTAAALLADGNWTQTGDTVQVEVRVKKTMLSLTMNGEAERIVKSAARGAGFLRTITVVSAINGSTENGAGTAPAKRPPTGSLQAEALAHPLVRQAMELFNGEVRSVLDLREKRNS
jgi:DNA polymerase-3 subunit gamma/tau